MTDRFDRPDYPENLEFQVRIPADHSGPPTVFFDNAYAFLKLMRMRQRQDAEGATVLALPPASSEVTPVGQPLPPVLDERQLPTMLTPAEAAAVLRISKSSFYSRVQRGEICGVVRRGKGRRSPILIDRDAFLRSLRAGTR